MRLALVLCLVAAPLAAQKVTTGVAPGAALVFGANQNLRDSARVTITPPVPVAVLMFRSTDVAGVFVPLDGTTMTVGDRGCIYVVAPDKNGKPITGLHPTITSSNPAVVSIGTSPACPDTTVDLKLLPVPLVKP
jgi:hypothetical protein